jgi:serine/threonine protein kinase
MESRSISHYEVLEKLGEGGMGDVYKARDMRLGRFVALKFVAPRSLGSAQVVERFREEARAVSSLNHPHIETLYDIVEDCSSPVLVLEYLPGGTLHSRAGKRALSLPELLQYALPVADGLGYAHRRGIVHRDVKTENVMFAEDGRIKIADFSLANFRGAAGTPAYMSPECAQGLETDRRTDIFSLGVLLYELAAGATPFGDEPAAALYAVIHKPAPSVKAVRPDLPEAFERVVQRALAKDRECRYQRMEEVAAALRALDAAPAESLPTVELQPLARAADPDAPRRILVVEDEEDLRKAVGFGLSSEGYQVLNAANGREGIRAAMEKSPDLVLLDVTMPGLNGFDACRELRQRGFLAPIIMVTGRAEEIDRVVGLEIGADDYLVKPYSVRELVARIRGHLRRGDGWIGAQRPAIV